MARLDRLGQGTIRSSTSEVKERPQGSRDACGVTCYLSVGKANDLVPQNPQLDIARAVLLEGHRTVVVAVAVGLGDERTVTPEEIHGEWTDGNVRLRWGQSVALAKGQKLMLKLAARGLGPEFLRNLETEHGGFSDRFS